MRDAYRLDALYPKECVARVVGVFCKRNARAGEDAHNLTLWLLFTQKHFLPQDGRSALVNLVS